MRYLIIALLTIPLAFGAEEGNTVTVDLSKIELPAGVKRAEEDLNRDLARLAEQYRVAVEAAKERAVRAMELEQRRAREVLVAAAIRAKVDEVKAIGVAEGKGLDLLTTSTKSLGSQVVGTWQVTWTNTGRTSQWTINDDGTYSSVSGNRGTWEIKDNNIVMTWATVNAITTISEINEEQMKGIDGNKGEITMNRR